MFKRRTLLLILGATLTVAAFSLIEGGIGSGPQHARGAAIEKKSDGKSGPLTLPPAEPIGDLMARMRDGVSPPPPPLMRGRNIFALTHLMRDRLIVSAPVEDEIAAQSPESAPSWTLRGIVLGERPLALINDRILGEGAMLGDYRIERILRDRVILAIDELRIELQIPVPTGAKRDRMEN